MTERNVAPRRSDELPVRAGLICVGLAVLAVLPFSPAVAGGWILDDIHLIRDNPRVQGFADWATWFRGDMWGLDREGALATGRIGYYRPLVFASYALDWTWGGGAPWAFHVTNLLLHGAVVLLAWATLKRWTDSLVPALVATALFAVHPTKAECVSWISGRTDVLCTLGLLVALAGIARRARGLRGGVALEVSGTLIAYGSKELAVVLPVLACVEAWAALGRPSLGGQALRSLGRAAPWVLPQVLVAFLYLGLRAWLLPLRPLVVVTPAWGEHAAFVLEAYGRYFALLWWPDDLSLWRALVPASEVGPVVSRGYAALGAGGLAASLGVAAALRRRAPSAAWGLVLFVVLLLPNSAVVWSGTSNPLIWPRFLYLPALAACLALGQAFARKPRWWRGVAALLVLLLAGRTALRAADFSSSERFWAYELRQNPDKPPVLTWVVSLDAERGNRQLGIRRASCAYQVAKQRYPRTVEDILVIQGLQLAVARTPDAEREQLGEIADFIDALQRNPANITLTRPFELRLAATNELPRFPSRAASLALLRADTLVRLGSIPEALEAAAKAVSGCPHCRDVLARAGEVALRGGAFDRATERFAAVGMLEDEVAPSVTRAQQIERARALTERAEHASGVARAQLLTTRDSELGLWGAALGRMLEVEESLLRAGPEGRVLLAQVAARAGRADVTRSALAGVLPEGAVTELLHRVQTEMGFIDRTPTAEPFASGGCALASELR